MITILEVNIVYSVGSDDWSSDMVNFNPGCRWCADGGVYSGANAGSSRIRNTAKTWIYDTAFATIKLLSKLPWILCYTVLHMGHAVAQVVIALRYKSEVRGFDSRWCHWHNLSGRTVALGSTQPLTEMSTRNISWGDKGGRCVGLTLPPSCADCLEIWEPQPPGTLRVCPGL